MRIVYFTHSLVSCWNHGNAHFLRGVLRELTYLGHDVEVFEPDRSWSLDNLLRDHGEAGLSTFRAAYPTLSSRRYQPDLDVDEALDGADVVIVHEWNEPWLVATIGKRRRRGGRFVLLFHDTHHRVVSEPAAMQAYDLDGYDGILAFGEAVAEVYRDWGWGRSVAVWHEAADTRLFRPPAVETERSGLVWIGNWGDGERSAELESYLFRPARAAGLSLDVYGVRYPDEAQATLAQHGARYLGWAPNAEVPNIFRRFLATVHVPRSFYVRALPGIPTIRVFEALACGIPLISAPWSDAEGLFQVGLDFLMVSRPEAAEVALRSVREDRDLRASLVQHGLRVIRSRHTCAHRALELTDIVSRFRRQDAKIGGLAREAV